MYLHAGPTVLDHISKQNYSIIGAKKLIKSFAVKYVLCIRYKANTSTQVLGILPKSRVKLERLFLRPSIDCAESITRKFNKGHGERTTKSYIALFGLQRTKAIQQEAV
ncbi:hypothetical protein X975_09128, partial [Stegodyphus mimosarum]